MNSLFKILSGVCILCAAKAGAQMPQNENYLINGTFNGIRTGVIKMLSFGSEQVEDSAKIVNGKFTLKGRIRSPEQKVFQITPGIWSFRAFVEPAKLFFAIDTTGAKHSGEIGKGGFALIWQIEEKGSEMADTYNNYLKTSGSIKAENHVLALREKLKEMHGNASGASRINSEIDSLVNNMLLKKKMFMEKYVDAHPSSVTGAFLLSDYYSNSSIEHRVSRNYLQSILPRFSGQAEQSIYYQRLAKQRDALKNSSINAMAPDFTLLKPDRSNFMLSSLKGNYVLLDFWASWCGPCRKAIPHWKEVNAQYGAKGLKIVSVSCDRIWNDWIGAVDKEQMSWIQVIDDFSAKGEQLGRVFNLFPSPTIPFYVLIDKEGKIVMSTGDETKISRKIAHLIK